MKKAHPTPAISPKPDEPLPAHLVDLRSTDDDLWYRIRLSFDHYSSLFGMRLETEEEAVGKRVSLAGVTPAVWVDEAPKWEDQEAGLSVRSWLLLPYIDALDQEALNALLETGRDLIPRVHAGLVFEELSPGFLRDWGRFCAAAGALELIYQHATDVGHARSAKAGGDAVATEDHKRWFAHYFLPKYKRGKRPEAEAAFERLVGTILDGKVSIPREWSLTWFAKFLCIDKYKQSHPQYRRLRETFKEHELSVRDMKKLAARGSEGIPPIDLEFPDP